MNLLRRRSSDSNHVGAPLNQHITLQCIYRLHAVVTSCLKIASVVGWFVRLTLSSVCCFDQQEAYMNEEN